MTRRRTVGIAALVVIGYLAILAAVHTRYGLTDDDDFYVPAGISYAQWLGRALTFDSGAWTKTAIDAAFEPNHEHPPVAKYVFGVAAAAFSALGPTDGARVGTVFFSGLIAGLLLWLAVLHLGRTRGLMAGVPAVVFLLTLPRFQFHSHAATLDVPVAAMYLATAALALAAERSRRAAWAAGVVFGLACATKLNAPFLLVPYAVFAWLVRLGEGRQVAETGPGRVRLPDIPLALVTMVVMGPLVFLASWPWLWFDTIKRLGEYIGFHFNHYGIYFLYFGRIYDKDPFAPWHAPFTLAAITVPLATSVLALVGLWLGRRPVLDRVASKVRLGDLDAREADLILTAGLHAVFSVAVVAFSGGPKYGGAKLFMPFFPFWCLLAGYGVLRLWELAAGARERVAAAVAIGLAVASSSALTVRYGVYALSEYNTLAGGVRGATALGFERQYYDIAFKDLVEWINENAPKRARVHFLPNNWEYERTYKWYRKTGLLRKDVRVIKQEGRAHLVIITHERRFDRYGHDLLRYRDREILAEKILDGTPIWTVLKGKR